VNQDVNALFSNALSGLIPVNKPVGMTSKDVSRLIMKRFGKLKLGHVGTLDPDADGVLPLLLGRATKLQDYLLKMTKSYRFEFKLGTATDTLDASGKVVLELPWDHVTESMLKSATKKFHGIIRQTPPMFSAVKYKGKELYKYARTGSSLDELTLNDLSREIEIKSLSVDSVDLPIIRMSVECSKGTYVRTLALDISEALGTTAHVTKLTRLQSAGFAICDCATIEQICSETTALEDVLIPLDRLAIGLPAWSPDDMVLHKRLVDGQSVIGDSTELSLPPLGSNSEVLLKAKDGSSTGIVTAVFLDNGQIKLHLKRGL
jgi:tRNA pseudouridine55 synthase